MTVDLRLDPVAADAADFAKKAMQDVIKIRRGAKATVKNALVKGTGTVIDLVDLSDGKGAGSVASSVSLTAALTNPKTGKDVNPGKDTAGVTLLFPNVNATVAGNTGCAAGNFSWTGYTF